MAQAQDSGGGGGKPKKKLSPRLEGKIYDPKKKKPYVPPRPPWTPPKPPKLPQKKYTVKKGDNYMTIAQEMYDDQELAGNIVKANPFIRALKPGMIIDLPRDTRSPQATSDINREIEASLGLSPGQAADPALSTRIGQASAQFGAAAEGAQQSLRDRLYPIAEGLTRQFERTIGTNIDRGVNFLKDRLGADFTQAPVAYPGQVSGQGGVRSNDDPLTIAARIHESAQAKLDAQALEAAQPGVPTLRNGRPIQQGKGDWQPMIGESPMYQVYKGKSPLLIDPVSQRLLKLTDQDLTDMGYQFDGENWRRLAVVDNYGTLGAGAYTGYAPYRGYGGGGGGGGGGGTRVSGAPGSGGYKPPPGSFGLVTWSGL